MRSSDGELSSFWVFEPELESEQFWELLLAGHPDDAVEWVSGLSGHFARSAVDGVQNVHVSACQGDVGQVQHSIRSDFLAFEHFDEFRLLLSKFFFLFVYILKITIVTTLFLRTSIHRAANHIHDYMAMI